MDEVVLRLTHLGRREIKATMTEDERHIQTLTIQQYSAVSGPFERTHFSFVGSEINTLLEFIIGLRTSRTMRSATSQRRTFALSYSIKDRLEACSSATLNCSVSLHRARTWSET
jgi:hypothetical protein